LTPDNFICNPMPPGDSLAQPGHATKQAYMGPACYVPILFEKEEKGRLSKWAVVVAYEAHWVDTDDRLMLWGVLAELCHWEALLSAVQTSQRFEALTDQRNGDGGQSFRLCGNGRLVPVC
jgi:hypothetical protein